MVKTFFRTVPPHSTSDEVRDVFSKFAQVTSRATGHPAAFLLALLIVVIWGATGPIFDYSDTWQLVINTGTTIVTFLMVFLIQNTQNRDSMAMHLKLDELLRAVKDARTALIDLEDLPDEELMRLQEDFVRLQARASAVKAGNREKRNS